MCTAPWGAVTWGEVEGGERDSGSLLDRAATDKGVILEAGLALPGPLADPGLGSGTEDKALTPPSMSWQVGAGTGSWTAALEQDVSVLCASISLFNRENHRTYLIGLLRGWSELILNRLIFVQNLGDCLIHGKHLREN